VNRLPIPSGCSVTTVEDVSANIAIQATDPDANGMYVFVTVLPTMGSLYVNSSTTTVVSRNTQYTLPNGNPTSPFYYTPNLHAYGSDSFTYYVNDGCASTAAVSCAITVTYYNYPPVAYAVATSTNENVNLIVTMNGTDVETPTSGLIFMITQLPDPTLGVLKHVATGATVTVNTMFTAGENTVLFVPVQYACCDIAQFTYQVYPFPLLSLLLC
jgi:hypothetical protein